MRGTRERKHPHYLKGVLHCGVCGRRLSIQHSKGRYTYFFCLGQKNDPTGTCRERYVAADDLEAQVEQLYTAIQLPGSWAERLREELDAEVIARQRADAAQRELLTRRVAKAEAERRTLLDADYSGAIDVPTLKVEQARIGADLTAAKDRLADLDADLTERQEILELAVTFATRCGDAYRKATDRKATDRTRKQFSAAVFTRLAARRETRLAARRERRADLPPGAAAALRRHLQRARVRIRDTRAGDGNRTRVLSLGS